MATFTIFRVAANKATAPKVSNCVLDWANGTDSLIHLIFNWSYKLENAHILKRHLSIEYYLIGV